MVTKPKKLTYNPLDLLVSEDPADSLMPVVELDPTLIAPNPHQPRQYYDDADQVELTASVRESGIHQPLLVRPVAGAYELVAGSRRLAVALTLGLPTVPVVVREYSDEEAEQVALLENLQRANLRFDDEAHALLRVKHRYKLSNEALGRSIGKSTDYVELRIAAAEHPIVLDLYMSGGIEQKQIRLAVRMLAAQGGAVNAAFFQQLGGGQGDEAQHSVAVSTVIDPNDADAIGADDPNGSDQRPAGRGSRAGRRPPDGWRWAGDAERRLQQLPARAPRMDAGERRRAREYLLRLHQATEQALHLLAE
ncbi:MAG: ParB/RepB/Spo0J family partition protein [Chloroflexota bacterium]|nr:ParB/RepB/Spo0J family partition protein [Chloroflexota bacterium]